MKNNLRIKRIIAITFLLIIGALLLFIPLYAGSGEIFEGDKYAFTDDELKGIASMCQMENGSSEAGIRIEASLMANLYESDGKETGYYDGTTAGFIKYITESGWFATSNYYFNHINVTDTYLTAVEDVLVNGNRAVANNVVEHDCMNDILYVSNNGVQFDKYDRSQYIKDVTIIENVYGSAYKFYCFPDENGSDPFGYIYAHREKIIINTMPERTIYAIGDTLDTKGLSIAIDYWQSVPNYVVSNGFTCTPTTLNTIGTQEITVKYGRYHSTTFSVQVEKRTVDMTGIKFEDKTVTYNGNAQSIEIGETLPEGITGVTYEGNGQTNVGEYIITAKFEVDTELYKEVEDITAKLTITKAEPLVRPVYDESKIIYESGSLPEMTLTEGDTAGTISWNPYTLEAGTKDYTWTFVPNDSTNYNSKTGTINIPVQKVEVSNIGITNIPNYRTYIEGQDFNPEGMQVTATYNDGTTKEVTNYTVQDASSLAAGRTSVTISYTEDGVTVTTTQSITVIEKLEVDLGTFEEKQEGTTKYIANISSNTKISKLLEKIQTNQGATIEIYKGTTQITDTNVKIATGMKLKISLVNQNVEYTIVVTGDTDGDGEVRIDDMDKVNNHRLNKSKLTGEYLIAGDVNKDNKLDIYDIFIINKLRLGK